MKIDAEAIRTMNDAFADLEIRDERLAMLANEVAGLRRAVERRAHLLDFFDDAPLAALNEPQIERPVR